MPGAGSVLGIEVDDRLLADWSGWLAPVRQPFFLTAAECDDLDLVPEAFDAGFNDRDTYELYNLADDLVTVTCDESEFFALPRSTRSQVVRAQVRHQRGSVPTVAAWKETLGDGIRGQADGHRFVWWPSLLQGRHAHVLPRLISEDALASRHNDVDGATWSAAAHRLPGAQALAGTFPDGSGANCFATVMAAAGVAAAANTWMLREPFDEWLTQATTPGGRDNECGTVLVWRTRDGAPQHAAITLGAGWALHKPSQSWMSPRAVLTTATVIGYTRRVGWRLHRSTLT